MHISKNKFTNLAFSVDKSHENGLYLEFGVGLGYTINVLAECIYPKVVHGFDTFEGLPEDWKLENGVVIRKKGSYAPNNIPHLKNNVSLHKGLIQDTLPKFLSAYNEKIALCHIDTDLYFSCKTILEHITPCLKVGSIIVFDEIFNGEHCIQHEYRAFTEWLKTNGNITVEFISRTPHEQGTVIIKTV